MTHYIFWCVDTGALPQKKKKENKKQILHIPDNKQYITKDGKTCRNNKRLAFKNMDVAGAAANQKIFEHKCGTDDNCETIS